MTGLIIQQTDGRRVERSVSTMRALRSSVTFGSPNKSLQGSMTHKVLGRGRPSQLRRSLPRARVLKRTRAAPELNR